MFSRALIKYLYDDCIIGAAYPPATDRYRC